MNKKIEIIIIFLICLVSLIGGILLIKHGAETIAKTQIKFQDEKNQKNIEELEKKYNALSTQEEELKADLDKEFQINGNSEKYLEIENKIKKISEDKTEIDFEISKTKNGYYDNKAGINESIPSGIIYILPGIILCIISFILVVITIKKVSE